MEALTKTFVPRGTVACEACRLRKRRCDGQSPCSYCVVSQRACIYTEQKKRGPKKRKMDEDSNGVVTIVGPSNRDIEISERAEAFSYLDKCWHNLHRLQHLTNMTKIRNPSTAAHKVQAYAAFALSARLCGNKSQSQVYINQARMFAGEIFDSPEPDSIAAMLLMGQFSMLSFDMPRASFYAGLGNSLCKMIPIQTLNSDLYIICQLMGTMNCETSAQRRAEQLQDLTEYVKTAKRGSYAAVSIITLFWELNQSVTELLDQQIFYTPPMFATNAFAVLDKIVITEQTRMRMFELVNIIMAETGYIKAHTKSGFITKIFIPVIRAIVNWKSGHLVEALDNALQCFTYLNHIDEPSLYALLTHFPQIYLLGGMVKLFMELGQFFLAQQMGEQVKKICNRLSPDLDNITQQIDLLLVSPEYDSIVTPAVTVALTNNMITSTSNNITSNNIVPSNDISNINSNNNTTTITSNNDFNNNNNFTFSNNFNPESFINSSHVPIQQNETSFSLPSPLLNPSPPPLVPLTTSPPISSLPTPLPQPANDILQDWNIDDTNLDIQTIEKMLGIK